MTNRDDMDSMRDLLKTILRNADNLDGRNDGIINRRMALQAAESQRMFVAGMPPEVQSVYQGAVRILQASNVENFSRITEAGIDRMHSPDEFLRQFQAVVSAGTEASEASRASSPSRLRAAVEAARS